MAMENMIHNRFNQLMDACISWEGNLNDEFAEIQNEMFRLGELVGYTSGEICFMMRQRANAR